MTFRPKPSCLSSARLACVKRAASVHPEPGSNSLVWFVLLLLRFSRSRGLRELLFVCLSPSLEALDWWSSSPQGLSRAPSESLTFSSSQMLHCSIFNVLSVASPSPLLAPLPLFLRLFSSAFIILPHLPSSVNSFFLFFLKYSVAPNHGSVSILY